jgi:4-hydroxy-2-oxoheptanedioate aldolase
MPRIKQLLKDGKVVRVFGLGQLLSPKLVEILGEHGGFDALWLDFEHAGLTMTEIELATMAARYYGMDHFVRQPATDYASLMRALEAGAGGVMISMARSPADAEQAVRWAKFWPEGERGLNGGNRDGRFGLEPLAQYTARVNAETFVGIQIETADALASVAEIAAVRFEPGPGSHRRFREPQVPRGHRADRAGVRSCRQALGGLQPGP